MYRIESINTGKIELKEDYQFLTDAINVFCLEFGGEEIREDWNSCGEPYEMEQAYAEFGQLTAVMDTNWIGTLRRI